MTKHIRLLLILCVLNGVLTTGWLRLKVRNQTLQRKIQIFPSVRNDIAKAQKNLQSLTFPWKSYTRLADTQADFEKFFKNALQSNFVWAPDSKPFGSRKNVNGYSGKATAFFFYPHVRPLLEALVTSDMPLWIRSMQIVRHGSDNAGLQVTLTFDAAALNETTSVVEEAHIVHSKHSPEATTARSLSEPLPNE